MLEAAPIFFGNADAPLFGWCHLALPEKALGLGLVICNPFGFEEVCAHRGLGHLAVAAAASGVATLRFDYAGCGNSSGSELDPDTVARWLASIHTAIDTLKRRSGVQQVALLGLRLGATLAAMAAASRTDVAGVVAIAPVVQGRLYLRELRILAETTVSAGDGPMEDFIGLESAGFLLTKEAMESISALDLHTVHQRPAASVLIVDRDDLPSRPQWANALTALGANVTVAKWPGYRDMMTDPQRSLIPVELIARVVTHINTWRADQSADIVSLHMTHSFVTNTFHEMPVKIEVGGGTLFGLLTTPISAEKSAKGILLVNSGSVHNIGPNRLWVRLARSWAARGMTVLRLDLSGIGDSPPRPGSAGNVVYSAEAGADIDAAIRYMREQLGMTDCRMLGLCSGAYHSFKAAVNGVPFTLAVLINPLTFFWDIGKPLNDGIKDYEVVSQSSAYRKQIFSLEPWSKLLRGQLDIPYLFTFAQRRVQTLLSPFMLAMAHLLRISMKQDLARELVVASRTSVQHFVFASKEPGIELLKSQGKRSLDRLVLQSRVTVNFIPDADHTFTRLEARDRLVKLLDQLMFGEGVVA